MTGIRRRATTPKAIPPWVQALRKDGRENLDAFVQSQIMITDPAAQTVPLKYKWGQRRIANALREMEAKGKPTRLYVLKSRQIGTTTQIANRNFARTLCTDNLESVTIGHLEHRARDILRKAKFAYRNLPKGLQLPLSADSNAAFEFADTAARMIIGTAENALAARGGTIQHAHISEFAYYRNAEEVLYEIEQVCHMLAGTSIVLETTGKKFGSFAHYYWRRCRAGHETYVPLFLPWQDDPECDYQFENDYDRDMKIKEAYSYEYRLEARAKHFNLTPGNVYWAYLKLRDQAKGNWEKFLEDYPCDDEECWRSKGDTYFDSNHIMKLQVVVDKAKPDWYIVGREQLEGGFSSFEELQKNPGFVFDTAWEMEPNIAVWQEPRPGRQYVVSGDSASGSAKGDHSSTFVIDMNTGEMMAEFDGLVQPHQHAKVMESLGYIYHVGMLAPESNWHGMATLQQLRHDQYPNMYIWKKLDTIKDNPNFVGWYTGTKSRQLMLALLYRAVEEAAEGTGLSSGTFRSQRLLSQMRTFMEDDGSGKPAGAPGCPDDTVMALAIAWFVSAVETQGSDRDILKLFEKQEQKEPEQESMIIIPGQGAATVAIDRFRSHFRLEDQQYGRSWEGRY